MKNNTSNTSIKTYTYHLATLIIDNFNMFLPQSDIKSIESLYELTSEGEYNGNIGVIHKSGDIIPVYSLSKTLDILDTVPEKRNQCVVIKHDKGDYAVICTDTRYVVMTDAKFQEIPMAMRTNNMPLKYLCLFKNEHCEQKLGMISDSKCLKNYILTR